MQVEAKTEFSARVSADTRQSDGARWKAAREFEALWIHQMFKAMRRSADAIQGDEPDRARALFTEMLDEAAAEKASLQGGVGLASLIYRHLGGKDSPASVMAGVRQYAGSAMPVRASAEQVRQWSREAARAYNLDEQLLRSLIDQESGGDSLALSSKGAMGLTQLMPKTAREVGVENPWDGRQNIFGGARYLRRMLDLFNGNEALALAAYNAGPGAVMQRGGIPEYAETQHYVRAVLRKREQMRNTEVNHER